MGKLETAVEAHRLFEATQGSRGAMFGTVLPAPRDMDLRGTTVLAGLELEGTWLTGSDLTGADLAGTSVARSWMNDVIARRVTAPGMFAKKTEMEGIDFSDSDLTGCYFVACDASRSRFDRACMEWSKIYDFGFEDASLVGVRLRGSQFITVRLDGADLTGADLTGVTGTVFRPRRDHPSWDGLDLMEALRVRGADVTYVVL